MRKSIFVLLLVVVCALLFIACGGDSKLDDFCSYQCEQHLICADEIGGDTQGLTQEACEENCVDYYGDETRREATLAAYDGCRERISCEFSECMGETGDE